MKYLYLQFAKLTQDYTSAELATLCKRVALTCQNKHKDLICADEGVDINDTLLSQVISTADFQAIVSTLILNKNQLSILMVFYHLTGCFGEHL